MSIKGKKEEIIINNTNSNKIISPSYSSSSSIFEDINFSALFNPNDKYINSGEKTSYNFMAYDLGIFSSLSNIYKSLNIPYDKINSYCNSSIKQSNKRNRSNNENNNENAINSSNNKDSIIFTDSIIKLLLSEKESENKKLNKNTVMSLNEEDLDELLKDYSPMKIEKKYNIIINLHLFIIKFYIRL